MLRAAHGSWEAAIGPEDGPERIHQYSWTPLAAEGKTVGMLGVATASYGGPRWRALTVLTGLLAAVVADGYVASVDSVTTYELGLLAAVLQPIWLVWTGRLLDRSEPTD